MLPLAWKYLPNQRFHIILSFYVTHNWYICEPIYPFTIYIVPLTSFHPPTPTPNLTTLFECAHSDTISK